MAQNNTGISGSGSYSISRVQRKFPVSVRVVALGSNGRAGEGNAAVLAEKNKLKEMREESESPSSSSTLIDDVDSKPTVAGGVQDVYGEDSATEDQFVTPWSVSVAR